MPYLKIARKVQVSDFCFALSSSLSHTPLKRIPDRQIQHQVVAAPVGLAKLYLVKYPAVAFGKPGVSQRHGQVEAQQEE